MVCILLSAPAVVTMPLLRVLHGLDLDPSLLCQLPDGNRSAPNDYYTTKCGASLSNSTDFSWALHGSHTLHTMRLTQWQPRASTDWHT
jgi:hypothetical protein